MKIIRFTREQTRRWRENKLLLCTEDLKPHRTATLMENEAEYKHSLEQNRLIEAASMSNREYKCVPFVIEEGGKSYTLKVDRDLMRLELLNQYKQDLQVRGLNGKIVTIIRDPSVRRPTAEDSRRSAPRPEHCQCNDWKGRQPGRHHWICSHNKDAPLEERAFKADDAVVPETDKERAEVLHDEPLQKYVDRKKCGCRSMPFPNGSDPLEHHPTCSWFGYSDKLIIDLDSGNILRHATKGEAKEARENLEKSGAPTTTVGEHIYGVQ